MPVIRKTAAARKDYKDIWHFVARDSVFQADRLLHRFDEQLRVLAAESLIGRPRPDLAEGLRSWNMGHYIFFYSVIEDGIELIRLLHSSRDIQPEMFGK